MLYTGAYRLPIYRQGSDDTRKQRVPCACVCVRVVYVGEGEESAELPAPSIYDYDTTKCPPTAQETDLYSQFLELEISGARVVDGLVQTGYGGDVGEALFEYIGVCVVEYLSSLLLRSHGVHACANLHATT